DLKRHEAAGEFEAVVCANASALQVATEGCLAGGAGRGRVRGVRARHDPLRTPEPFRSGLLAGLLVVRLAGFLRRGGGRLGVAAVVTPIGVVARRRARTRPRIRAQTVGQIPCQPERKPKLAPHTEPDSTSRDRRKWGM